MIKTTTHPDTARRVKSPRDVMLAIRRARIRVRVPFASSGMDQAQYREFVETNARHSGMHRTLPSSNGGAL